MQFFHIAPLVFLVAGFVLVNLTLFAGDKAGFMEEYAIVRINMSDFGKNLFSDANGSEENKDDDDDKSSVGDILSGIIDDVKDKAADTLNQVGNRIAGRLTEELGIEEWYSIHIQEFCQGNFRNGSASFDVLNCTMSRPGSRINLTEILDGEMAVGPIDLSLADFRWPAGIQRQVSKLNSALHAVFVFYVLAVALAGAAVICNAVILFLPAFTPILIIANAVLAGLASVNIGLGSTITTVMGGLVAETITDLGEFVGVTAVQGTQFLALTWVAFGVVTVAAAYWANEFRKVRKTAKMMGRWEMKEATRV
ncbi:unnamed protein product [Parascedosporium putredinis]|uniref:Sur7 protein n=1 Tax=Parascedosporium putredinis TaxID=1442378 RepID=A0A9P1H2K5_9PEZI|nr:unnamed protein product [Parascedosporium putredinis]CAI7995003.1 unnamed protein product [Parascedosporium putredinis]